MILNILPISDVAIQENVVEYIDGLVQDCSNSIADALELLQSCTKPSILSVMSPSYFQARDDVSTDLFNSLDSDGGGNSFKIVIFKHV